MLPDPIGRTAITSRPREAWDRLCHALLRPRGDARWDAVIRGTGAVGLLGILLALVVPGSGPLIGLGIVTIWMSGPLSPFFPVGLEPILMLFGRLYPPWLVAAASMGAGLFIEYLNYYLYGHIVGLEVAREFRESRLVRWCRDLFDRSPFFAIWFCAWSPVPFWVVRILAPLSGYSVRKYLLANLLGRYPKLWLFATLGLFWDVSDRVLLIATGGGLLLGLLMWAWHRLRRRPAAKPERTGAGWPAAKPAGSGAERPTVSPAAAEIDVLYVIGIGRSGSTLLGRALGESAGHFPAGEVKHLFDRGIAVGERCSCGRDARGCPFWGEVIRNMETGGLLDDPQRIGAFTRSITRGTGAPLVFSPWQPSGFRRRVAEYKGLMEGAYAAVWEACGRRTLVDTSKNLAWARLLLDLPRCRVRLVHLVRDSRGVAHSFEKVRRRPGNPSVDPYMDRYHAVTTAMLWNLDNLLAERLGARAADYIRLSYTDFVTAPRRSLGAILGNGAHPGSLAHVGEDCIAVPEQHVLAGNPMRFQAGSLQLREDLAWQREMSAAKKGAVTALTWPLLRRYGYLGNGAGRDRD